MSQIAAYALSLLLIQKVFIGPTPTVRADFIEEVKQLPTVTKEYAVALPSKIKTFIAAKKLEKEIVSRTPPPWVFEPLPGEVSPTMRPRPTRVPGDPGVDPTQAPEAPQPTSPESGQPQRPIDQPQPTRVPQPTRAPLQPTSAPADASSLEQQVVQLINQRRRSAGLGEVQIDGHLTTAARGHSTYMSSSKKCGHTGANNSNPFDRAKDAGYRGQVIGETVGCGFMTAEGVVQGWWDSPGHKAILTSQNARQIGLGWVNNYQTALVAR